jgi:cell division protein FtsQ
VAQRERGRARRASRQGPRVPLPSLRSAAAGFAIVGLAVGAFLLARDTSLFAIRTLDVTGGSPHVRAEVARTLRPVLGQSLLRVDEGALTRELDALPDIVSAHFDRSFPHTLHVAVKAERAVLLVRQGSASWVVSARGRVMRKIKSPHRSALPRLWVAKSVTLTVGETLPREEGLLAAAAVAPISRRAYPGGVRGVLTGPEALTLVLGKGTQIRLGDIGDLGLKLTIARRILEVAASNGVSTPAYVDVSVPERPVLADSKP